MQVLGNKSSERKDSFKTGGELERGDILTKWACPAFFQGQAVAKSQEVSPFPEQEKSGEAMFNSSDSFFSRERRDVSQKEHMSKTALLGLSVRIA